MDLSKLDLCCLDVPGWSQSEEDLPAKEAVTSNTEDSKASRSDTHASRNTVRRNDRRHG